MSSTSSVRSQADEAKYCQFYSSGHDALATALAAGVATGSLVGSLPTLLQESLPPLNWLRCDTATLLLLVTQKSCSVQPLSVTLRRLQTR